MQIMQFKIQSEDFEPAYMELFHSGELYRRSRQALRSLANCKAVSYTHLTLPTTPYV